MWLLNHFKTIDMNQTKHPSKMTSILVTSFLFAALQFATTDAVNYCNLGCRGDNYHIGCAKERYAGECGKTPHTHTFTEKQQKAILKQINEARDHVAKGGWGLPLAARLKRVVWNKDLAYLAKRSTMGCVANTYACRNTEKFEAPGQLNFKFTYDETPHVMKILREAVKKAHWQKFNISREVIESYTDDGPKGNAEELALVLSDRVTAVGCGLTTWNAGRKVHALLTCNFSSHNSYGRPVYRIGKAPGEKCLKKDPRFTNLCAKDEPVDPNNFD